MRLLTTGSPVVLSTTSSVNLRTLLAQACANLDLETLLTGMALDLFSLACSGACVIV